MDWAVTGALGGVAILALGAGYEFSVIGRSSPEPAKQSAQDYPATPALIPTLERSLAGVSSSAPVSAPSLAPTQPALAYAPAAPAEASPVSEAAEAPRHASRVEPPPAIASRPKDHAPPPDSAISGSKETRLLPLPPPQPKPQISSELWLVRTTAKASYFNLGGHVDKNGMVDGLASGYLREALMKHRNYAKLPAPIQASIAAPSINLAKIAGYRALLGMDDREMEEKQGVKFVKIAGSRSIAIASPGAADPDVLPFDLGLLERMNLDLRFGMTLGFAP